VRTSPPASLRAPVAPPVATTAAASTMTMTALARIGLVRNGLYQSAQAEAGDLATAGQGP